VTGTRDHWEQVYRDKGETEVSWHQPRSERSLRLIRATAGPTDPVIDVGGGASRLVDDLLAAGYEDITVLDISATSLARSRARLGALADRATWIAADVTAWRPERTWRVWHDRAVFHFLTEIADQDAYVAALARATAPGAMVVIATFAPDGPAMCSGLPVVRWDSAALARRLGDGFRLTGSEREEHVTPWGSVQRFVYTVLERR
jgi:SAM-dependent methyltransferase